MLIILLTFYYFLLHFITYVSNKFFLYYKIQCNKFGNMCIIRPSEEIVRETELPPVDTEGDTKSGTKKKKKKSGKENVENVLTVEKDGAFEEPVVSTLSKPKKVEVRATVEGKLSY